MSDDLILNILRDIQNCIEIILQRIKIINTALNELK